MLRDIGRKSPIWTSTPSIWRSNWGWPCRNFAETFGIRVLESRRCRMTLCAWSYFINLGTMPVCDWRTDRQTDTWRQHNHASIASCGKTLHIIHTIEPILTRFFALRQSTVWVAPPRYVWNKSKMTDITSSAVPGQASPSRRLGMTVNEWVVVIAVRRPRINDRLQCHVEMTIHWPFNEDTTSAVKEYCRTATIGTYADTFSTVRC